LTRGSPREVDPHHEPWGKFKRRFLGTSPANHAEAEACFHRALEIARGQKAKFGELRAATSLARLWRDLGKPDDARDLLAPV
jgi:predicted ATPase